MEKMGTKKIDIPLSAITIKGRPTDLDMVLTPADKITVEVAAVDGSLDNIDQNDVKAVLDLTSYQKEGRHEVPVQITLPECDTDFGSEDCRKPDQKAEDKRQQYGDFSCGGVEVSKNYYRENRRMR